MTPLQRALETLEGLSLGDAFGQCFFQEADPDHMAREQRLPAAPWYYTDDTEMSLSMISVLRRHGCIEQAELAHSLAQHYDYDRAYGPSMHRVLERIRQGEPWQDVGRNSFEGQGSYGNGAAMRAAPLGAYFADDLELAAAEASLSAKVTHAHPEGIAGAIAVALAAALAWQSRGKARTHEDFLNMVVRTLPPSEVRSKIARAASMAKSSWQFAVSVLGNGTGMSAQDTVPYALWCCGQALNDWEQALWLAVGSGGDRDTLGAIVGGIMAARLGVQALPPGWLARREVLPDWHLH
ncbi:MAG TPA: ADP-ribosylglycohydrolase family protein [Burkholderiaceae bacterium]